MNRRDFVCLSAASAASISLSLRPKLAFAEDVSTTSIRLTIRPDRLGRQIAEDFTGLSYESAQMGNPHFFSGDNAELAGFMRQLGKSGVLRIGGNTSEYCYWAPSSEKANTGSMSGDKTNPVAFGLAVGPDKGLKAPAPVNITPLAVHNLRDFLDACGWKLIYGLNMGTGTPEAAAAEAAAVMMLWGRS